MLLSGSDHQMIPLPDAISPLLLPAGQYTFANTEASSFQKMATETKVIEVLAAVRTTAERVTAVEENLSTPGSLLTPVGSPDVSQHVEVEKRVESRPSLPICSPLLLHQTVSRPRLKARTSDRDRDNSFSSNTAATTLKGNLSALKHKSDDPTKNLTTQSPHLPKSDHLLTKLSALEPSLDFASPSFDFPDAIPKLSQYYIGPFLTIPHALLIAKLPVLFPFNRMTLREQHNTIARTPLQSNQHQLDINQVKPSLADEMLRKGLGFDGVDIAYSLSQARVTRSNRASQNKSLPTLPTPFNTADHPKFCDVVDQTEPTETQATPFDYRIDIEQQQHHWRDFEDEMLEDDTYDYASAWDIESKGDLSVELTDSSEYLVRLKRKAWESSHSMLTENAFLDLYRRQCDLERIWRQSRLIRTR